MFSSLTEIAKVLGRMGLALFILTAIFAFLPPIGLPDDFAAAINYLLTIIYSFNFLLPVASLIVAVGFVLLFDIVVMSWNWVQWVFNKFRIL